MKFFIHTLGCKVNQYESQAISENLLFNGYEKAKSDEEADILIINSCTVTSVSDQKVRKLARRLKRSNPEAIVILTGCMPQAFSEKAEEFDYADIVLGNSDKLSVVSYIKQFLSDKRKRIVSVKPYTKESKFEKINISHFDERTRAFIKIEDGCDRFCSYCIIPYARGRVRSKNIEDIKEELEKLSEAGYKEVVLTGINLCAYGKDLNLNLCDAVNTACSIKGINRVRLSSLEPDMIDIGILKAFSQQEKFCPHFHLVLQSGCDKTLKKMNRHYNTSEYFDVVNNIYKYFKNPSITTDVMVGFPGETEDDFNESVNFMKKVDFAKVHVFPYSIRKGTKAAEFPNQITKAEKTRRAKIMADVCNELRREFLKSQIGQIEDVLFETKQKENNVYEGYTKNYTPVKCNYNNGSLVGKLEKVRIVDLNENKDKCVAEKIK